MMENRVFGGAFIDFFFDLLINDLEILFYFIAFKFLYCKLAKNQIS